MIYVDGIHMVADSNDELHKFAQEIGIPKCWYEGVRKGHPHYDIPKKKFDQIMKDPRVKIVRPRELLAKSKTMKNITVIDLHNYGRK